MTLAQTALDAVTVDATDIEGTTTPEVGSVASDDGLSANEA